MAWVLVTGGAKRLGAQICRALARDGYDIIIHYRESRQKASEVAEHCSRLGVRTSLAQGDFSTRKGVDQFLKSMQEDIAHLVNNVGQFLVKPASLTTLDEWENLMQVNFLAPIALSQGLLKMIRRNRGTITNIGHAGINFLKADTKYTAYTSSKRALLQWTRSLAKELAPEGVRVNMVSPGELENSVSLKNLENLPMGRAGTLEEVSDIVSFLMSKNAAYVTGQNIEVAGGYCL